jgi:hypothetical protein
MELWRHVNSKPLNFLACIVRLDVAKKVENMSAMEDEDVSV